MDFQHIARNHDMGACVPTFQERVNTTMLPVEHSAAQSHAAAEVIDFVSRPQTPHLPTASEVEQTLSMMENEAHNNNMQLLKIHSGLNRDRVERLLGLLR